MNEEEGSELVTICHELKILELDGKMCETDCANIEGAFRLIQSIPSKKAEPIKMWLAKVGNERVQEINDPEISLNRALEKKTGKKVVTSGNFLRKTNKIK